MYTQSSNISNRDIPEGKKNLLVWMAICFKERSGKSSGSIQINQFALLGILYTTYLDSTEVKRFTNRLLKHQHEANIRLWQILFSPDWRKSLRVSACKDLQNAAQDYFWFLFDIWTPNLFESLNKTHANYLYCLLLFVMSTNSTQYN